MRFDRRGQPRELLLHALPPPRALQCGAVLRLRRSVPAWMTRVPVSLSWLVAAGRRGGGTPEFSVLGTEQEDGGSFEGEGNGGQVGSRNQKGENEPQLRGPGGRRSGGLSLRSIGRSPLSIVGSAFHCCDV